MLLQTDKLDLIKKFLGFETVQYYPSAIYKTKTNIEKKIPEPTHLGVKMTFVKKYYRNFSGEYRIFYL